MEEETRRERQRRILIDDILDAARSQLDTGGAASISLRGIGRAVGMSAPSLYTYIPNRADLFTKLILQSYEALAHAVSSEVDAAADGTNDERLMAGPRAYRRWALANRQQFNLIFFDQVPDYEAPPAGPTIEAETAVLRPIAAEYARIRDLPVDDLDEPGAALDLFLGWWGAFHGLVALEVNHHLDWVDANVVFEQRLRTDVAQIMNVETL